MIAVFFCDVIDNYGDIGVTLRVANALSKYHIQSYIITTDKEKFLEISLDNSRIQGVFDIFQLDTVQEIFEKTDVVIEMFGMTIDNAIMKRFNKPLIINLEYLNTEEFVESLHLTQSYSQYGEKWFFMPGFHRKSGGVIFDIAEVENLSKASVLDLSSNQLNVAVFSYDYDFSGLIAGLETLSMPVTVRLFSEKRSRFPATQNGLINVKTMPFMTQTAFDTYLLQSDLLFVRGEDSFVRAVISGKPFLWQAYRQDSAYHIEKVQAFLDIIRPFMSIGHFENYRALMMAYNSSYLELPHMPLYDLLHNLKEYEKEFKKIREYVVKNCDLVYNLYKFIRKNMEEINR